MAQVASMQLDTSQAQQYAKYLQQAPVIAEEEMRISLEESLLFLEREVKERTPVGVGGGGGLRGSITYLMQGSPVSGDLQGKVFSPLRHALPVEMGTKPHFPPVEPIRDWVEKKLGVSPDESASVAFLVARKISRDGTEGAHMFENALTDNGQQLLDMLYSGIDRLFLRLNRGE